MVNLEDVPSLRSGAPFGWTAREMGIAAIEAADCLANDPHWDGRGDRRWLSDDYVAFDRVMTTLRRRSQSRSTFQRGLRLWFAALPLAFGHSLHGAATQRSRTALDYRRPV